MRNRLLSRVLLAPKVRLLQGTAATGKETLLLADILKGHPDAIKLVQALKLSTLADFVKAESVFKDAVYKMDPAVDDLIGAHLELVSKGTIPLADTLKEHPEAVTKLAGLKIFTLGDYEKADTAAKEQFCKTFPKAVTLIEGLTDPLEKILLADILKEHPKAVNWLKASDLFTVRTVADFVKAKPGLKETFHDMFPAADKLIKKHIGAVKVDVDVYLSRYLNNTFMKLQERDEAITDVVAKIHTNERLGASSKPTALFLWSSRGMGKTQFIKSFLATDADLRKRLENGRVITRCLDSAKVQKWLDPYVEGKSTEVEALIALIVEHVRDVLSNADLNHPNFTTVKDAYNWWVAETKYHFRLTAEESETLKPLIVFDTAEKLAQELHPTKMHRSTSTRYTLLEAIMRLHPAPYAIVAVGCKSSCTEHGDILTTLNIVKLSPLQPLSEEGLRKAFTESWGAASIDEQVVPIVHELTAGVPRLAFYALTAREISFMKGSLTAISDSFNVLIDYGCSRYPLPDKALPMGDNKDEETDSLPRKGKSKEDAFLVKQATALYFGGLCAAVRWNVCKNDFSSPIEKGLTSRIPMPSMFEQITFKEAVEDSFIPPPIADGTCIFPPILFRSPHWTTRADMIRAKLGTAYTPLSMLYPALGENFLKNGVSHEATSRGLPWEQAFVHAVFTRYNLSVWAGLGTQQWVDLCHIFPKFEKGLYETNLSQGLHLPPKESVGYKSAKKNPHTMRWNTQNHKAHHDAYMWARNCSTKEEGPIAIQTRHGQEKLPDDVISQLCCERGSEDQLTFPMLLCYQKHYPPNWQVAKHKKAFKNKLLFNIDGSTITRSSHIWIKTPYMLPK